MDKLECFLLFFFNPNMAQIVQLHSCPGMQGTCQPRRQGNGMTLWVLQKHNVGFLFDSRGTFLFDCLFLFLFYF